MFLAIFTSYRGDTINVNQRVSTGIVYVMDCVWRYIANFAFTDLEAVLFANQHQPLPGKENEQFFMLLSAMLATAFTRLQIYPA